MTTYAAAMIHPLWLWQAPSPFVYNDILRHFRQQLAQLPPINHISFVGNAQLQHQLWELIYDYPAHMSSYLKSGDYRLIPTPHKDLSNYSNRHIFRSRLTLPVHPDYLPNAPTAGSLPTPVNTYKGLAPADAWTKAIDSMMNSKKYPPGFLINIYPSWCPIPDRLVTYAELAALTLNIPVHVLR